jgi:hypothetical protein
MLKAQDMEQAAVMATVATPDQALVPSTATLLNTETVLALATNMNTELVLATAIATTSVKNKRKNYSIRQNLIFLFFSFFI